MSLGKSIARLRKQRNLSQADLAAQLDVHPRHVTRWETDRIRPRPKTLQKIADALEASMDELMAGERAVQLDSSDPELSELLAQIPRLEEHQKQALKTVLRDMLTRSQLEELLHRRSA